MVSTANEKNPNVKVVYTSIKGTKIYSLADPLNISAQRGISAEKAKRFADMNLSESEMKSLIKEYKRSINIDQDFVRANSIVQEIEYRLEFICEENSIYDLAALYFLVEGEDLQQPSEGHNKTKREHYNNEADVRAFFLQNGLHLINKSSQLPEGDLLTYLEKVRAISERIYRYIART